MGRQRQPCGGFALIGWLAGRAFGVILGLGLRRTLRASLAGLSLRSLRTALLPGLALAGLACLRAGLGLACMGLACMGLACAGVGGLSARFVARERTRRILRSGKGIKSFWHEQAGKPPALPQRTDRVYERKSHEHSSQATSALL